MKEIRKVQRDWQNQEKYRKRERERGRVLQFAKNMKYSTGEKNIL